jgi:asparagine synthase (glutamine-hydrolysing)
MSSTMVHRGPDDEGFVVRDTVGLAMRRLEIIDPPGGHQPIHNEDETIWIVFNGEIYNFPDLAGDLEARGHRFYTRTDTEVVVHAYEEWGEACVDRLNGMFGFALWDGKTRRLFLARDRMGIKPLYYAAVGRRFWFGSELKALLADPEVPRDIDLQALSDYLMLEFVPSPRSIFRHVRKVPPGHVLTWDQESGEHRLRRYWDVDLTPSEQPAARKSLDEHAEELRAVLLRSVQRELISDVPLGVFLSGGIDSSSVAAMMAQLTPGNVSSFSIGFNDPSFDESAHARRVAGHLGTNHHEQVLEPHMISDLVPSITERLDEPLADASIIPTYLLSRFTRGHVKVALGGDGGDELFAGYPTLQAHRLARYYELLPQPLHRYLVAPLVNRLPVSRDNVSFDFRAKRFVAGMGLPPAGRHITWTGSFPAAAQQELLSREVSGELADSDEPDIVATHLQNSGVRDPLNQILYLDMKLYLEGDILVKADRASMMASLEARVPLLNSEFVEHVTKLPISLKLHGLRSKYVFKHAMKDLLPADILQRRKKGFGIPVGKWVRGPLKELFLSTLAADRVGREGFFDPRAVQLLMDEHLAGRRDNRKQLWTLFMFERWYETYGSSSASVTAARAR